MSDASVRAIDGRAVVKVGGSELLAPIVATATDAVEQTESNRAAAELASATAIASSRYFATRAAGQAASTVDQMFSTDDGAGNVVYYRRTAGGSVEIGRAITPAALAASSGSSLIGTKLNASAAVLRFTHDKLGDNVSVKDFGAYGNDSNADTASIADMLDYLGGIGGGEGFFPKAEAYIVDAPVTLPSRVRLTGPGGHVGAVIRGTHGGPILIATSDSPNDIQEYTSLQGLAFSGEECTAITQDSNVDYLSRLMVNDVHFYGQLALGIDGNLIFGIVEKSSFGYYGTTGTSHRHIRSRGKVTNVSNNNTLMFNRFYQAKGGPGVEWENGSDLHTFRNNFEQNRALPLLLKGMPSTFLTRDFFEGNQNTDAEIVLDAGSALVDSSPLVISGATFVPYASIKRLVQLNVALSSWAFDYNTTTNMAGKVVTNDASALRSRVGNMVPGIAFPSRLQQEQGVWNATDASGAGLTIAATGSWERQGNDISLQIAFTFPVNTSNANAKIGGLPYAATMITPGSTVTNYAGGLDICTDGASNTATFYAPGALTQLTNSQLSGKIIYLSLRYPAA